MCDLEYQAETRNLMTAEEAMNAIRRSQPIVIESRKYGIVADWYSARDKNEFAEWLRGRALAGAYPEIEYGRTWRAWHIEPTAEQRKATPWGKMPRRSTRDTNG